MKKYKTITEFLSDLDSKKRTQIDEIRKLILDLGLELKESIKWNAPNYNYNGIDRITFNIMNKEGSVKIIIHMGASIKEDKKAQPVLKDESGLIVWNSNIRGTITFDGPKDLNDKKESLKHVLKEWLKLEI